MCGFVGVIGVDHAALMLSVGLQAIQHRGQDAAGIGTYDDVSGRFQVYKDLGMVTQALPAEVISAFPGGTGIAHVRYPTLGGGERGDAQPFLTRRPGILMAHNGTVTNLPQLESELRENGLHILSRCDSEPILLTLADELTQVRRAHHTLDDVALAVGRLMKRVRGSYSVVSVLEVDGRWSLLAFRDPSAIRPGVFGKRADGAWMVASETVALDALGFKREGFLPAGSIVVLRKNEEPIIRAVADSQPRHCVFERIYFARADSVMEDGRVNSVRWRLGQCLAREWESKGLEADVIVPVPDTSRPAAAAMAEYLEIPNREGFIKNRYSGRTFIMPDQPTRDAALRLKLNPIDEVFTDKRVLLVDDSIVRGSTMRRIVKMVREFQPKAVHLGIFSPPVRFPCFLGIDMPSREELIAGSLEVAGLERRLAMALGADSLTYLSQEGLSSVGGEHMCAACFSGDYPVIVSDEEKAYIQKSRRAC
ncbi:MAG: amidophosphoribosyltransferase [Proteobacteria bacterium]|nr:amidophosphoribosyltransferase [Pseudomonadota bacterium]